MRGQLTVMSRRHRSQTISNKVRLRIVIRIAEYVRYGAQIGDHKPATSNESMVRERSAVFSLPGRYKVGILHIMHLLEVAQEERGRGRPSESPERRNMLSYDQSNETGCCEAKDKERCEDGEKGIERDETIEHRKCK
jgi:hypothetical protein